MTKEHLYGYPHDDAYRAFVCPHRDRGHAILTEPWYSERPGDYHGEPYGIALADLPRLDGVAVSHDHYDHYDMQSFAAYPHKEVPFALKRGTGRRARQAGFFPGR